MQPHRQQPTRLPRPWDSPGKNTGVGCHFLLQCMKVKRESEVTQSSPTLSNPMDWSLPGSSVHGIFQARVKEGVGCHCFLHHSLHCLVFICMLVFIFIRAHSWLKVKQLDKVCYGKSSLSPFSPKQLFDFLNVSGYLVLTSTSWRNTILLLFFDYTFTGINSWHCHRENGSHPMLLCVLCSHPLPCLGTPNI